MIEWQTAHRTRVFLMVIELGGDCGVQSITHPVNPLSQVTDKNQKMEARSHLSNPNHSAVLSCVTVWRVNI